MTSNFHGPGLVDVLGGVGSLVALTIFLRFWQPKEIWRFPEEPPVDAGAEEPPLRAKEVAYAWVPWIVLSLTVFLWGWPTWKAALNGKIESAAEGTGLAARAWHQFRSGVVWCEEGIGEHLGIRTKAAFPVPRLEGQVYRARPVVPVPEGSDRAAKPEEAVYELNWLSTTGTGIFLAAVLSAIWLRISPGIFFRQFADTLFRVRWALFTIACMLALAFTTKYSGADATLGLAFTHTGWLYPFFAPMLGWLGVALTGSDTSANALFGSLQRITAERMLKSKQEIPCFYLTVKVDMTELTALRTKINESGDVKVAYNDFIMKAVATGLEKYAIMTGQLAGDVIKLVDAIHVGLAISVPDGLVAPLVKDVNKKNVRQIARDSQALIERAKNDKLDLSDLEGGCITISNLGAFGIESFIPIVVPGQCSILGIGRIADTCVPDNGNILVRKLMNMTLSVDHKVANGAYAAQFLDLVKKMLEEPRQFTM